MFARLLFVTALAGLVGCSDDAGKTSDMSENNDIDADADLSADQGTPDDSGARTDAAGDDAGAADVGVVLGDRIEAPNEAWTWVDFPDALCGNGQPTGIGVNLTDRSDDVFVYFMGGGACWDVNSCFVLNAAVNIESGYGEARFENEGVLGVPAYDRDDMANPIRDLNWVFVPYCTGDLHAGDKVTTYMALGQTREVHHVGAANVRAFLRRLVPTFSDADRVLVSGSSAGGYGAQMNFHQFVDGFRQAEVHVLNDSGPLVQPVERLVAWDTAWSLQTPAGCANCNRSLPTWHDHLVTTYPDSRFGLLTYDADQTIHVYFGYPVGDSFQQALASFLDDHVAPAPNAQVFALAGTQHVLLGGLTTIAAPDGTTLSEWTTQWLEGDADWDSVRP